VPNGGGLVRLEVLIGGEVVLGREPADVADLAEERGCQHRPDSEQLWSFH
jgi:hypothetical protein